MDRITSGRRYRSTLVRCGLILFTICALTSVAGFADELQFLSDETVELPHTTSNSTAIDDELNDIDGRWNSIFSTAREENRLPCYVSNWQTAMDQSARLIDEYGISNPRVSSLRDHFQSQLACSETKAQAKEIFGNIIAYLDTTLDFFINEAPFVGAQADSLNSSDGQVEMQDRIYTQMVPYAVDPSGYAARMGDNVYSLDDVAQMLENLFILQDIDQHLQEMPEDELAIVLEQKKIVEIIKNAREHIETAKNLDGRRFTMTEDKEKCDFAVIHHDSYADWKSDVEVYRETIANITTNMSPNVRTGKVNGVALNEDTAKLTLDEVFSDPDLLYQIFRQYDFDALLWQEKVSSWLADDEASAKQMSEPYKRVGTCRNGERQGKWALEWRDGLIASGVYAAGSREGEWVFQWPDGRVEDGPYEEDVRHGYWTEHWADGRLDQGRYERGVRHGLWTLTPMSHEARPGNEYIFDPSITSIERTYVNGGRSGVWRMVLGTRTIGYGDEFDARSGHVHGNWMFYFPDGGEQSGPMVDSKREGTWVIRWADGTQERGRMVEDERSTHWDIHWSDGTREQGYYRNGKRFGPWMVRHADGHEERGSYSSGRRDGTWVIRWPDGARGEVRYEYGQVADFSISGEKEILGWKDGWEQGDEVPGKWFINYYGELTGQREGLWAFVDEGNRSLYINETREFKRGTYLQGKRNGEWLFRSHEDGTFSVGYYFNGLPHGHWVYRTISGSVHHLTFEHGIRHGYVYSRHPSEHGMEVYIGWYANNERDGRFEHRRDGMLIGEIEYINGQGIADHR